MKITHSPAEGTLFEGDPRPHHPILKTNGFRWSRNQGFWYVARSRDTAPRMDRINAVVAGFAALGITIDVELEQETRSIAEREADRAERAEARAEHLSEQAERLEAKSDELDGRRKEISDMIPFGQPVLVGHHSEGRHRRDIGRIDSLMGKSVEAHREATEASRRADAAIATQEHRESGPATLRRIERLEVEQRDIERRLMPCKGGGVKVKEHIADGTEISCVVCRSMVTTADHKVPTHGNADGEYGERLRNRWSEIISEVAYWKAHVESLKDEGFHEYGPDDFKVGDRVNDATVVRVNKKSLTVQHDVFPTGMTNTLAYNKVKNHESV